MNQCIRLSDGDTVDHTETDPLRSESDLLAELKRKHQLLTALNQALVASEEKYRLIANNTTDIIWVWNLPRSCYTFISPSVNRVLGYTVGEAMSMSYDELMTPASALHIKTLVDEAMVCYLDNPQKRVIRNAEIQHSCKNGQKIWIEVSSQFHRNGQGEIEIIGVSRNIEDRKKREEEILFLTYHDQLTGLYNRNYLQKVVDSELYRATRYDRPIALLVFDVDCFKQINDCQGHLAGDGVMTEIADLVTHMIRESDLFFRYGGDEFLLLLPETGQVDAEHFAERIRITIQRRRQDLLSRYTCSFGVAERKVGEPFTHWFNRADAALYRAKHLGRNRVVRAEDAWVVPVKHCDC